MDSHGSVNVFSIIAISVISSCLFLSCCGYVLSQRQKRKHQIQLMNNNYASEPQAHVFTVDMPQTPSLNNGNRVQACPHLLDKHPPPYETVEIRLPAENPPRPTTTDDVKQS